MDNAKISVSFDREMLDDDSPDVSYLEQDCFDDDAGRERLAAFHAGAWHMVGVRAVATIEITRSQMTTFYTLKSAGLWGIESDSGEEYFQQVFAEACAALRADIDVFCHGIEYK